MSLKCAAKSEKITDGSVQFVGCTTRAAPVKPTCMVAVAPTAAKKSVPLVPDARHVWHKVFKQCARMTTGSNNVDVTV